MKTFIIALIAYIIALILIFSGLKIPGLGLAD